MTYSTGCIIIGKEYSITDCENILNTAKIINKYFLNPFGHNVFIQKLLIDLKQSAEKRRIVFNGLFIFSDISIA